MISEEEFKSKYTDIDEDLRIIRERLARKKQNNIKKNDERTN